MGEYPVPSITWKRCRVVHFAWEFGTGDTACNKKIPKNRKANMTPNRAITCKMCLYQVYDIRPKSRPIKQKNQIFSRIKQ